MAEAGWSEVRIRREIQRLVGSDEPARAVEAKLGALRALLRDCRAASPPVDGDGAGAPDPMADLDPPPADAALLNLAEQVLPFGAERDRWMRRYDRGVSLRTLARDLEGRSPVTVDDDELASRRRRQRT